MLSYVKRLVVTWVSSDLPGFRFANIHLSPIITNPVQGHDPSQTLSNSKTAIFILWQRTGELRGNQHKDHTQQRAGIEPISLRVGRDHSVLFMLPHFTNSSRLHLCPCSVCRSISAIIDLARFSPHIYSPRISLAEMPIAPCQQSCKIHSKLG